MKFKIYSWLTFAIGVLLVAIGILTPFFLTRANGPFSIIGGAGMSTLTFLISYSFEGLTFCLLMLGLCLIITALFCLIFTKTAKTHLSFKTSAVSLAASAVVAAGLYCIAILLFIGFNSRRYPITAPVAAIGSMVCLCAFLGLAFLYFKLREKQPSRKGVLIDIAMAMIYCPAFLFSCTQLERLLKFIIDK